MLLAQAGHVVSGVDSSAEMVRCARAKAEAAGVEVALAVGDAADPPWPVRSIDAVVCRHVLWALPDPGAALDRWLSLLVPSGGRLVLVEGRWGTGAGLPARAVEALVRERADDVAVRTLEDPTLWGAAVHDERYLITARRR